MIAPRICVTLILLVTALSTASAFSATSPREINRRDAVMTTTTAAATGLLQLLVASPVLLPATAAAVDLSQYQDGPKGIKYLVTLEGGGTVKPQRGQKVRASYTLYLNGFPEDGDSNSRQVDSSKGLLGDQPFEFNVGVAQVIKGWDISLLDMVQGEARRLVIPSDVGYGDQGAGGGFSGIPGGATLYFDVQLTELGKLPVIDDNQREWLEQNPL
eukprot:CAMPEP_0119016012 /NCGR_PEP_ID=MMETSP1176-20130426/11768_1 /TAXON_ID=265551 /ORGANISM="Synedropsis recta cf, Strain CCMP1620" /LENGTH=214 /DNA_ID=CAMNT_0006969337 /DNA_START=49 /DNA_END=693 /DNA_ORIENTATION=+